MLFRSARVEGAQAIDERTFDLRRDLVGIDHVAAVGAGDDAMDGDLARTVAFFKSVDQRKPTPAQLKKQLRINDEKSVEFVRAYEAAIVRTIESMLIRR